MIEILVPFRRVTPVKQNLLKSYSMLFSIYLLTDT